MLLKLGAPQEAIRFLKKGADNDPKYSGTAHPLAAGLLTFLVTRYSMDLALWVGGAMGFALPERFDGGASIRTTVALMVLAYWAFLLGSRVVIHGKHQLYDSLWACNVFMAVLADGLLTNNPGYVGLSLSLITVDQSLFWIDGVSYLTTGKFITGAAKYLTWPETTRLKKLTSTHHLWFMPVCAYFMEAYSTGCLMTYWLVSPIVMLGLSFASRFFVPKQMKISHGGEVEIVELNINLVYACWKDVDFFWWLKSFDDAVWYIFIPYQSGSWFVATSALYAPFVIVHYLLALVR